MPYRPSPFFGIQSAAKRRIALRGKADIFCIWHGQVFVVSRPAGEHLQRGQNLGILFYILVWSYAFTFDNRNNAERFLRPVAGLRSEAKCVSPQLGENSVC